MDIFLIGLCSWASNLKACISGFAIFSEKRQGSNSLVAMMIGQGYIAQLEQLNDTVISTCWWPISTVRRDKGRKNKRQFNSKSKGVPSFVFRGYFIAFVRVFMKKYFRDDFREQSVVYDSGWPTSEPCFYVPRTSTSCGDPMSLT